MWPSVDWSFPQTIRQRRVRRTIWACVPNSKFVSTTSRRPQEWIQSQSVCVAMRREFHIQAFAVGLWCVGNSAWSDCVVQPFQCEVGCHDSLRVQRARVHLYNVLRFVGCGDCLFAILFQPQAKSLINHLLLSAQAVNPSWNEQVTWRWCKHVYERTRRSCWMKKWWALLVKLRVVAGDQEQRVRWNWNPPLSDLGKARHFDASNAETTFVSWLWYVPVTFDVGCGHAWKK